MNSLSVRAKLSLAFGGLSLLVLVVAALAVQSLSDANARFERFVNGVNARTNMAHLVREAIDLRAIAARNLVLVTQPEDTALEKDVVTRAHADVQKNLAQLQALAAEDQSLPEEPRRMIAEMAQIEKAYSPVALGIVELALQHQTDEAIVRINRDCRPLLAALVKASLAYSDYASRSSAAMVQAAQTEYAAHRNLLIGACVLVLALAMVAGLLITRSLTNALGAEPTALCDIVNRVANGDLSTRTGVTAGDSSSVLYAVSRMQTSLTQVVASVRAGSQAVATASAEIAQGNHDLSARTEQQASALEETAASMEQLGSTVRQNADSARQASQLATSASQVAVRGGDVVRQVVETMKDINTSSRKISDIISVIDGIAFQTNILALNAAVEAARAGEQGRGFAVVASEVRSLAGRSAQAAKEIAALINDSVSRVSHGTDLVDQAGATMTEIVGSIQRVTDIVSEISAASTEQATGVAQVGEAVTQMDRTTQQNAALVEQMAAAAGSLKSQSGDLVKTVAVFTIAGDSAQRAHPVHEDVGTSTPPVQRLAFA